MVSVRYKGQVICSLSQDTPVKEALQVILDASRIAPETLKVLYRSRVVDLASSPLLSLKEQGVSADAKLFLLGSTEEEVQAIRNGKDLPGLADLEHETQVLTARRRRGLPTSLALPSGDHTFKTFETWQQPGLRPLPQEALKLLHRLAADPGIAHIMKANNWTVQKLSEMPPEGKVGVSPVCILGVNINMGQEISLRLRTDDLKGFRRYQSILQTLCHELAHMVYGDHDANFKRLNSQLWRDCQQASTATGRFLARSAAGWDEQEPLQEAPTVHRLGGDRQPSSHMEHPLVSRFAFLSEQQASEGQQQEIPHMGHRDHETEIKERQVEALLESGQQSSSLASHTGARAIEDQLRPGPAQSEADEGIGKALNVLLSGKDHGAACQALQLLVTLLQNVVSDPDNSKYRRIRLENPKIVQKFGNASAPVSILNIAGFKEEAEGTERILIMRQLDAGLLSQILNQCCIALEACSRI